MHVDPQWIKDTYDRIVREAGDQPLTLKEIRESVAQAYAEAVESGELERNEVSLFDEGLGLFATIVEPERTARKARLLQELDYIADASADGTILGNTDPVFDQAYALGNGSDKTLGLWTRDDFQFAIVTRYRKASEATAAATAFDMKVSRVQQLMVIRNATYVRDLGKGMGDPTDLDVA
jgi:hypothetical protein